MKIDAITAIARRRYILGKQGLWPGRRWADKAGAAVALQAIEAVQMDPVSVVARSHDLALWGRVHGYQTDHLDALLYKERSCFEYGGGLFIYPIDELPYWRVVMERRKLETRWASFAQANPALLDKVRAELRRRGPLRSRDLEGTAVKHYRAGKDTGIAMYYLWLTGELMSAGRHGTERVFDFLENVAPVHLQWQAAEDDAVRFLIHKAVSLKGLVGERDFRTILKSTSNRPIDIKEARTQLAELVESGHLGSVRCEGQLLYFLAADAPLLDDLAAGIASAVWRPLQTTAEEEVVFLSPLEYVSARGRAKELFGFDFSWEIYKPAAERHYGPYTMPILYGDRLVARMDAKIERRQRTLVINGLWLEPSFAPDHAFSQAFAAGLHRLTTFLGADKTLKVSQTFRV